MRLIESIPNISEGRRLDVIASCASAIRDARALLLDVSSDAAHHRTVFTMASDAARIAASVLALVEVAVRHIDLRTHSGVHPRLGAVDVVPFTPLGETTMEECVTVARTVAAEVARRHGVPVYLYEEAARMPARRRLEVIRRGQFEGLASRMREPEWLPDFGPAAPHPSAGACIIGARWPLIAYNVNLATNQLPIAKAIAARVRASSGGLPSVKALGVPLPARHIVQVTMNLTNYRETSMLDVFECIRAEAARHQVTILDSELVGLVPAAALPSDPAAQLLLRGFNGDQVLEHRLQQRMEQG